MKIVFMSGGAREGALHTLLEKGENVVGVITPYLSEGNRRFIGVIEVAIAHGVPVYPIHKEGVEEIVRRLSAELLVSCGFPYLISQRAIESVQYAINVHPTLLPKYRGLRSGPYILINGEKRTGVTIHFMDKGMDTGDIILQEVVTLTPFDTTRSMQRKTTSIEGDLLCRAIHLLKSGSYHRIPQDESQATTYTHLRTPKDSLIDWDKPLRDLYNEIRACDPNDYPAHFFVEGQKVCVKLWRPDKEESELDMI